MVSAGRRMAPRRVLARLRHGRDGAGAPAGSRESMLPYYAYRAAETLVGVLPQRASYWLGDRVADALVLAAPSKLDALRDNLRHVMPAAGEAALRRTVRRNVRNLTHSWVDVMAMSSRRTDLPSRIDIDDFENFGGPMKSGRGVVVMSMHYGSWEVGIAGWNAMGGEMALLAEVLRPRRLFERVIGGRSKQGVHVIPIDVAAIRNSDPETARRMGASSTREVFRVLRSGGVIAMALDRDLTGTGELLPFFGEPAPIPIGVVDIAVRTQAAIVPIILHQAGTRVHAVPYPEIAYDSSAPRAAEVRRVTCELLALFERVIREHPDQWHVLDRIWPAPST